MALRQVERAFDYVFDFNPRAAAELAKSLIATGDSLVSFPYRGRLVPGTDIRELVTVYPYIIRYRIVRDQVRILRVRHTSRQTTPPECHKPTRSHVYLWS
jgi:plasmid stabilization system protein ParE